MYGMLSEMSSFLSTPFFYTAKSLEGIPLLFAFLLGLVGALAPCQFAGNLGAITIYGNQSLQKEIAWKEIFSFILGKIVVFTGLGFIFWLLGSAMKENLITFFPWIRKMVGPILIVIGLFLVGVIKFYKSISFGKIPERFIKSGKLGAFLMGISFSLGFCPTMFSLFFVTLMPISISVSYGVVLPGIFAIGTSLPLLIAILLIWYFGLSGKIMKKKGRKLGNVVQKVAGILLIILGVLDTITFW